MEDSIIEDSILEDQEDTFDLVLTKEKQESSTHKELRGMHRNSKEGVDHSSIKKNIFLDYSLDECLGISEENTSNLKPEDYFLDKVCDSEGEEECLIEGYFGVQ